MKAWHAAVAGAGTVAVANVGVRYFGGSFKDYLLVTLVVAFVVLSLVLRKQEKGLAEDLKGLSKEDQEDILSQLKPKDRERVRRDMEK